MRTAFILLLFTFISFPFCAQNSKNEPFEVYNIRNEEDGSTVIYATNTYLCEESVSIEFNTLKNMVADVELPFKGVVPAGAKDFQLLTLTIKDPTKESQFGFITKFCHGNVYEDKHDSTIYIIPYQAGEQHPIGQAYGGTFSHYLKGSTHAIDFDMEEGTPICAARGGIVIFVKDDSNKHGKTIQFQEYGNYITIYHEDGTMANYFHLQKNGSKVKVGDKITAGQIIALSGNTGWSSGPHLHFQVFSFTKNMDFKSIPTLFLQEDGKTITLEKSETGYKSVH